MKRINITINNQILQTLDELINNDPEINSRSAFVRSLISQDLKSRKIKIGPKVEIIKNWDDVCDMPLHPQHREVT